MKRLSLEALMEIQVTSVSRRPEKLTEAASAVQVIGGGDVRRSAATSISEALRLAPNLHVAQVNSYGNVVTARGFSTLFANKLLVMIDGRTVYTPLFAGVSWDVQNVLLEDLERIEVVSGPGATLWGTNAVNGVINIVTRNAAETQGLYAAGGVGTELESWFGARYGGVTGNNLHYRVYAQRFARDHTFNSDGTRAADAWDLAQAGFRLDWAPTQSDVFTLQGDVYNGTEETVPSDSSVDGQNLLARWTRHYSSESEAQLQVYFDRTYRRDVPSTLTDRLRTYDLDFQHRFPAASGHSILWGAGYRLMQSEVRNSTPFVGFVPPRRDMQPFSGFVQDEVTLVEDRLQLTAGTKVEHNEFSGFEIQPSGRLAWTPSAAATVWGALSRAVRSPSRIDVDYRLPTFQVPEGTPHVAGGPNFDSEKLLAAELGTRLHPGPAWSLSVATFYHRYDDLYSVEALPGTMRFEIQNGVEGKSWGAEIAGTWAPHARWRLRAGYTFLRKELRNKPGHSFDVTLLGNDPRHQVVLHSILDLSEHLEFDLMARFVDELPAPAIPSYTAIDLRLAWLVDNYELSVLAHNLGARRHVEFGTEVARGVHVRAAWRW